MRSIIFYRFVNGKSPVEQFLDLLPGKQAQKVTWVLQLVESMENVPAQYFKKLVSTEDIWEVRVQAGSDDFRLLGFFGGAEVLVLTNGFRKKSHETPRQEIESAERRRKDYLNQEKTK